MRWAMRIWLRWLMCWRPIAWRAKLRMSGWRVSRKELELLAVSMVQTSRSYHSLRMTGIRGMREAKVLACLLSSPSWCLYPAPLPATNQLFQKSGFPRGGETCPILQ